MAEKRKTGKRRPKSKRRSVATSTRRMVKKKSKKKAVHKKTAVKRRAVVQRMIGARIPRAGSGRQAGDLQGLSNVERADSESVGELIEEGNAFEADVIAGVEEAGNADEKEVRTREVPEDDVPGEYLDKE